MATESFSKDYTIKTDRELKSVIDAFNSTQSINHLTIQFEDLYKYPIGTQIKINSKIYTYLGKDPFDDMYTFSDGYTILYEDDLSEVPLIVLPINLTALIHSLTILLLVYLEYPNDNPEEIKTIKNQIITLKNIL